SSAMTLVRFNPFSPEGNGSSRRERFRPSARHGPPLASDFVSLEGNGSDAGPRNGPLGLPRPRILNQFSTWPLPTTTHGATRGPETTPVLRPAARLVALGVLIASAGCVDRPPTE